VSRQTIGAIRRDVMRRIGDASPTAALDARMIVAHLVGCAPGQLALRDDEEVSGFIISDAKALAKRRAAGEPVARITGEKEFHGLTFALSPETLVPRPDTETLVDATLAIVREDWNEKATLEILDLGTGSGAILISLLYELRNCTGVGIDLSGGALVTARENAVRHGVADRATFVVGNWTKGVKDRFDVVVANPPYIPTSAIGGLAVEVRDHDPHLALDGGADGLDAIHAIAGDLDRVLRESGVAVLEVGMGQAGTVKALGEAYGFQCAYRKDLSGVDRVAVLTRLSETAGVSTIG
jgi:release factor glutamine methyltransferase